MSLEFDVYLLIMFLKICQIPVIEKNLFPGVMYIITFVLAMTRLHFSLFLKVDLLRKFPTRILSRAWGYLADCHLPVWMRKPVINSYSYLFDCNLNEALESDVDKYETFNKFFSRKLKPGLRQLDSNAAVVIVIIFVEISNQNPLVFYLLGK